MLDRVEEMRRLHVEKQVDVGRLVPATLDEVFSAFAGCDVRIGDVLSFGPQNGLYLPKENYSADGTPMVHMGDMFRRFELTGLPERRVTVGHEVREKYGLHAQDVLVARRSLVFEGSGSMTAVGELDEATLFESSIIRIRPDVRRLLPAFLVGYFYSREGTKRRLAITRKATISGINQEGLLELRVPVPDLDSQRSALARISGIRALHAKVTGNNSGEVIERLPAAVLRKAIAGEL